MTPAARWRFYRIASFALFALVIFSGDYRMYATAAFAILVLAIAIFERVDRHGQPSRFGIPLNEDGTLNMSMWPGGKGRK